MTSSVFHNPVVCAIVLNWNKGSETVRCLDSLSLYLKQGRLKLLVCDNGSEDNSVEVISDWAKSNCSSVDVQDREVNGLEGTRDGWDFALIQTGFNRGYAGGNNIGIRLALSIKDIEFIWILNNDTLVEGRALDNLLRCAKYDALAWAFGSTIVDGVVGQTIQTAGGCRYYPLTSIMRNIYHGHDIQTVVSTDKQVKIDYVCGASLFCRAEMFKKIGLLDERFFLYYEEIDLAQRVRESGHTLKWCKESIVFHKGAVSTGGRSSFNKYQSTLSNYHENLSTLMFTAKHYPHLLPVVGVLRFLGKSFYFLIRGKFYLFASLFMAYRDAFKSHFDKVKVKNVDRKPKIELFGACFKK